MDYPTPQTPDIRQRLENDLALKFSLLKAIKFLEASEYELIQLMIDNKIWSGPVPTDPGGIGDIEWGLLPYWVHNPPSFIQDYIESNDILKEAWNVLEFFLPAHIDQANYNALVARAEQEGIVASDGTIYGDSQYEQLDPRWMFSLADYLIVVTFGDMARFSDKNVQPIPLKDNQNQVKIALVGDWGTGQFTNGEAISVMEQLMGHNPDYLIHLGDVYYAGTAGDFLPADEEMNNFLKDWPNFSNSFMLNSNHEMYSGAKGYFDVALADPRFSQQQGTSYFALQYAGWTIIGLDSAYYSSSAMFMTGSLGTNDVQTNWIQGLQSGGQKLSPDKVIVLTHHNALSADGLTEITPYWEQVSTALGGDPAAWYWGHVHDGVAYKSPTITNRNTLARCVGHGAVPYGDAFGLASSNQVDYYAHTPAPVAPRVLNGFVLLTIESSGMITEEFYEQGIAAPKFSKQYS